MFKSREIPAILKSVVLDSDDDRRIAKCVLHIAPLTHSLALELSPRIAEDLFRKVGEWRWEPRLEMTGTAFETTAIPAQQMEFREFPNQPTGGTFRAVEIRSLQVFRPTGREEFTLALGIRFEIGDRAVASRFLIDLYKQTAFLSFEPQQRSLGLERAHETPIGKFVNERARERRTGFGVRPQ